MEIHIKCPDESTYKNVKSKLKDFVKDTPGSTASSKVVNPDDLHSPVTISLKITGVVDEEKFKPELENFVSEYGGVITYEEK